MPGKAAEVGARRFCDRADCRIHAAGWKWDLMRLTPGRDRDSNVVDAAGQGEEPFEPARDVVLDLFRGMPE